ncbi:isoaspartyl peptidase/L-asparaginase family protein [Aridibaculum aurantiacum]|uniref:isoaspartyl peptidase/L-asparaginase family protein n=1 Tax=Aridibaculum aurantiacum TaxID=2810307 RepID=UPI001A95916B|nr:isoaspartyl peptidase/L-asparaginase [Aridibaculum aurantiacum]
MAKIAIAVHGGAGPDSEFIQQNQEAYKQGIQQAVDAGYAVLEKGGTAVEAVEAAVNILENNPLFNAGRGSAINALGDIEMCASIMNGKTAESGAVAIVREIKNPVTLAKHVMIDSQHIYLGDSGALMFAEGAGTPKEPTAYFVTDHAYEQYEQKKQELEEQGERFNNSMHGTVGAVALDKDGNIAAATSTGGTECNAPGRIGDSSMIGVGTYADNETCAVSATGDGEFNIRYVAAFHVAALVEYKGLPLKDAANYLIHTKAKGSGGDMGLIAINKEGDIAMAFNSERMHRGWKSNSEEGSVEIY